MIAKQYNSFFTPCLNPTRCGVKYHQTGSAAHTECIKTNTGGTAPVVAPPPPPPMPTTPTPLSSDVVARLNNDEWSDDPGADLEALRDAVVTSLDKVAEERGINLYPVDYFETLDGVDVEHYLSGETDSLYDNFAGDFSISDTRYTNATDEIEAIYEQLGVESDQLDTETSNELIGLVYEYDSSGIDDNGWSNIIEQMASNTPPELMRYTATTPYVTQDMNDEYAEFYMATEPLSFAHGQERTDIVDARVGILNKGLVDAGVIPEPLSGEDLEALRGAVVNGPDEFGESTSLEVIWEGSVKSAALPSTRAEEERSVRGESSDWTLKSLVSDSGAHFILFDHEAGEGEGFRVRTPVTLPLSLESHAFLDEGDKTPGWSWMDTQGLNSTEYYKTDFRETETTND